MEIELSSRGLLAALFRQKIKFFLVFLIIVLMSFLYASSGPTVYESRASLLVKFGRDAMPNLARPGTEAVGDVSNDRQEIMGSFILILKSVDLLRDAVVDFGAVRLYPDLEEGKPSSVRGAISRLANRDLRIDIEGRSNLITLRVRNTDSAIAQAFEEILIEKFLSRQAAIYNPPRTDFLDKQVVEAKQRLLVSQQKFQDFKNSVKISSLDEEMAQLITEKSNLSGIAFTALTQAQSTLTDLETKKADLMATHRPDSALVKKLQDSIQVSRERVKALQNDINSVTAQQDKRQDNSLTKKIAEIDSRIAFLESQRGHYKDIEQQVKIDQDNLEYYQQRGEEARVNQVLNEQNITRISVVDVPEASNSPVKINTFMLLLATILVATSLGLFAAFFFEIVDDKLISPTQLSKLVGAPVLATYDYHSHWKRKAGFL